VWIIHRQNRRSDKNITSRYIALHAPLKTRVGTAFRASERLIGGTGCSRLCQKHHRSLVCMPVTMRRLAAVAYRYVSQTGSAHTTCAVKRRRHGSHNVLTQQAAAAVTSQQQAVSLPVGRTHDPSQQQAVSLTHGPNTCSAVSELMISKADNHCSGSSCRDHRGMIPYCAFLSCDTVLRGRCSHNDLAPAWGSGDHHACRQCALPQRLCHHGMIPPAGTGVDAFESVTDT
jgi:hypothetical protein